MDNLKRKQPEGGFGPRMLNHSSGRYPLVKRRPPLPWGPPRMYPGHGAPRGRPPPGNGRPPPGNGRPHPGIGRPPRPYGDSLPRPCPPMRTRDPYRGGMGRGAHHVSRPPMRPHGLHPEPYRAMNNSLRLPVRGPPPTRSRMRGLMRGRGSVMPNNIRRAPRRPYPQYHENYQPPRPRNELGIRRAPPPEHVRGCDGEEGWVEEHIELAKEAVPTIDSGDSMNAANQNPDEVLLKLRPKTIFKEQRYTSRQGDVFCYMVEVDDIQIEAEATSALVAKRLVSFDALVHLQVPAVIHCNKICDLLEELEKCVVIRKAYIEEKVAEYIETCENDGVQLVSEACKKVQIKGSMLTMKTTSKYSNMLKRMYGYSKVAKCTRFLGQNGQAGLRCTIQHTGELWVGTGTSKIAARNHASNLVIAYYNKHPPTKFNKSGLLRCRTAGEPASVEDKFAVTTMETEPISLSDKLVQKAFVTTQELLKDIVSPYTLQRNYACVFKVTGREEIANCEIVAVGNGSNIIDKENIKSDRTAISDCSGEILAYRAFRRYLLTQIEYCIKGDESVFVKDDESGKFSVKDQIKFHFYTNYSPFGDMAYNGPKPATGASNLLNNLPTVLSGPLMHYHLSKNKKMEENIDCEYKAEDVGKIQQYIHNKDHKRSLTTVPNSENKETLYSIVSPSDKMALRAVCGCQGALLSLLLKDSTVFFSQYHIGKSLAFRRHDNEALERGLYKRLNEGQYDKPGPCPVINTTEWYISYSERSQYYCFLWSQGGVLDVLRGPQGLSIPLLRSKDHDDDLLSAEEVQDITDQEIISAKPSRYNTAHFFNNFKLICKLLDIPVSDIKSMKRSATLYTKNKAAVYEEFKRKGFGEWPKNI